MTAMLSPYRLGKARDLYNIFNVFNSLSWSFLAGNIITLFAMRLNASATTLGLLNALIYVAFFFLPLGKLLAKRFSIIRIYSSAWCIRAIVMIPLVFVPLVVSSGRHDLALGIIILGVFAFNASRGIGMIGNNPVLNLLAIGPDRGSYMTQIQVINSAVGMFAGFIIAILLGREPPLYLYSVIILLGILGGIFSGFLVNRLPEPEKTTGKEPVNFFNMLRESFAKAPFRHFIIILFLVALVSAIARAFLVVYSREVFFQGDGMVSLYSVFGGLGALMVGLIIKFLVDRIGVKPIYLVCTIMGLTGMIPIVFFPRGAVENLSTVILFLTFLHFIVNFGFLGAEGIAQTYFLALVPEKYMLDMGIVYFFVFGVAGAGGSFLAGLFLDIFSFVGIPVFVSFKILYALLIGITVLILVMQKSLTALGSLPFKGAIEVMFSFRDLRAITLLDKLNKTNDGEEEEALLGALHDTPSQLSIKGLLDRAKSPRLSTRSESLRALENLDTLSEDAEKALINDTINNPYTTAYISARILGDHRVYSAIPILRELAVSQDYMLAGEAIIALAKLRDEAFRPEIEQIILQTENPRLKIMGVEAFGIYGSPNSLSILLDILRQTNPPPYLRDEVILAMASILQVQNQFYPLLLRFLEDESQITTLCIDEAESAFEFYASIHGHKLNPRKKPEKAHLYKQAQGLQAAISAYAGELNGALLSRWIMDLPDSLCDPISQLVLSEAVLDDELNAYGRLRLLASLWTARKLRQWSKEL
ncbi:MFS transporter [Treponema sp. TIM-1]|uniref:MFS transporter n=1 Tax=Treponema sp. TIM-1 TaxID=2898417 RepID=UPI0039809083